MILNLRDFDIHGYNPYVESFNHVEFHYADAGIGKIQMLSNVDDYDDILKFYKGGAWRNYSSWHILPILFYEGSLDLGVHPR